MMNIEFRPDGRTVGSVGGSQDVRTIATLKDGQEIRVDVTTMSPARFRTYLRKILERSDLTGESRERIMTALGSTPEEVEPPDPVKPDYSRKGKRTKKNGSRKK